MERRRFLGGCACLAAALAGCTTLEGGTDDGGAPGSDARSAADGLPVPRSELVHGAPEDAIPAIVNPAFDDDWADRLPATGPLTDEDRVIGVARGDETRAYPLRVLDWHEVVNDSFHGPLLVTYCPLCRSGVTAERRAGGEVTRFGVSGLLYRQNLVMYDEATDSLWSQIEARAIRGPLTGERLTLVPSTLTTWKTWRERHPDTRVLLPPPASGTFSVLFPTASSTDAPDVGRSYDRNLYGSYAESEQIGVEGSYEGPLHPKTLVIGVTHGDAARAYPFDRVREAGVVNDVVGGLPVVVAATADTMVAYVRRVDGDTVTFARDGDQLRAAGSRWDLLEGRALGGPHRGDELAPANDVSPLFYFAWQKVHPDTDVWGRPGATASAGGTG